MATTPFNTRTKKEIKNTDDYHKSIGAQFLFDCMMEIDYKTEGLSKEALADKTEFVYDKYLSNITDSSVKTLIKAMLDDIVINLKSGASDRLIYDSYESVIAYIDNN